MEFRSLRAALVLLAAFPLASCNHSDVTGPSGDYVHIMIVNDSTASIWAPISYSANTELAPGAQAEFIGVRPENWGGGFAVARPAWNNLATVNFSFVQPPASKAGFQIATVHVTANPSTPVTAKCDRPDLVAITGVEQQ